MIDILKSKEFAAALIGGLFALGGVLLAHFANIKSLKKERTRELISFLHSIHTELTSVYERYLSSVGNLIQRHPPNQPFLGIYIAEEDYFTVYAANTHMIGRIPDPEIRKNIVQIYIAIKGHMDSFKANNDYYADLKKLAPSLDFQLISQDPNALLAYTQIASYGEILRNSDKQVKIAFENILPKIEKLIAALEE